jgi:hypothetical protein
MKKTLKMARENNPFLPFSPASFLWQGIGGASIQVRSPCYNLARRLDAEAFSLPELESAWRGFVFFDQPS